MSFGMANLSEHEARKLKVARETHQRAADEKLQMYELVHCVPTPDGVGHYALFHQRKRFTEYAHAFVYAQTSKQMDGAHFTILFGTRAEVAATPGIVPHQTLIDYLPECDPVTNEPPTPDMYRFGVAVIDGKSGVRICDMIDGEPMRFVKRESAEGALKFALARMLLPNYAATGAELRVVDVEGMDDFIFEDACAAQMREWKKGKKEK